MTRKDLKIGKWFVKFYFADDGYDVDEILDTMFDFCASPSLMRQSYDLMTSGKKNTGFTFTNEDDRLALVAIGPTDSGKEFVDTIVHELYHLAIAIIKDMGIDFDGEEPAYLIGDSARELVDTVCKLGCRNCR